MKKWEYSIARERGQWISPANLERFGQEGWELVSISAIEEGVGRFLTVAYFKRPVDD